MLYKSPASSPQKRTCRCARGVTHVVLGPKIGYSFKLFLHVVICLQIQCVIVIVLIVILLVVARGYQQLCYLHRV